MNHKQLNFRRLEQRCLSPKERSIDYFNSETNQSRLPCIDQAYSFRPSDCSEYSKKNDKKDSTTLSKEEYKTFYKSLCNRVFDITEKRCKKVVRIAKISMRGALISSRCLKDRNKNQVKSPSRASSKSNRNSLPRKTILERHNILLKQMENRQILINKIKLNLNNRDQMKRIFSLGSNLSELRYRKSQ